MFRYLLIMTYFLSFRKSLFSGAKFCATIVRKSNFKIGIFYWKIWHVFPAELATLVLCIGTKCKNPFNECSTHYTWIV